MTGKRKAAAPHKVRRNPIARSLRSPLFREKVVEPPERPDRPPRKPKHPKRLAEEESRE